MKQKIPIAITSLPLSVSFEEACECSIDDKYLINGICQYRKILEQDDVEIYKRFNNMLVTSSGYYFAFYEDDLKTVEDEQKVKPFMGEDGRLKVVLLDKEGKPEIKDLATLVAETFVPNPESLPLVLFKDNNPENCNSENLYYSK
jgi:hypothetical protein